MIVFSANVLVIISILYVLGKRQGDLRSFFYLGAGMKLGAGILLGLLYWNYYHLGDTIEYFNEARKINDLFQHGWRTYLSFIFSNSPSGDPALDNFPTRALFFSKWVSVVGLITNHNYWLMASYFSLLSFLASWFLAKYIYAHFPNVRHGAFFALVFFPSVVFWTSGLIKESFASAALYFIVLLFLRARSRDSIRIIDIVLVLISVWILWQIKFYYAAVFVPIAIAELLMKRIVSQRLKLQRHTYLFVWLTFLVVPLLLAMFIHPNLQPHFFLEGLVANHDAYSRLSSSSELITYHELKPTISSIILNTPKAILSGLYRPTIWEATKSIQFIAAFENLLLIFLTISFIWSAIKTKPQPGSLWLCCISYCMILCLFLALSTPNIGTLSRYKSGFLPFLVIGLTSNNLYFHQVTHFLQRKWRHFGL